MTSKYEIKTEWRTRRGWIKKALFSLKFNTYRCRYIKYDVKPTYYPKPNPKNKKFLNLGPETLTLISTNQFA